MYTPSDQIGVTTLFKYGPGRFDFIIRTFPTASAAETEFRRVVTHAAKGDSSLEHYMLLIPMPDSGGVTAIMRGRRESLNVTEFQQAFALDREHPGRIHVAYTAPTDTDVGGTITFFWTSLMRDAYLQELAAQSVHHYAPSRAVSLSEAVLLMMYHGMEPKQGRLPPGALSTAG